MRVTEWEQDRLLIFSAAELARRHLGRGLALNAPETVALICDAMLEAARGGADLEAVEQAGRDAAGSLRVMDGVRDLVDVIRLEVLTGDGTRLVLLVDPLGDRPPADGTGAQAMQPAGDARTLRVRNRSRRVVRVSSHFPFHLVNERLEFDREAAVGLRLDLVPGDTLRWAPGEEREVRLVPAAPQTIEP